MRQSLPASSPPQQMLFDLYHDIHGERIHDLPALLPEVWLHWDPQTGWFASCCCWPRACSGAISSP
jgi:hypothetical protein